MKQLYSKKYIAQQVASIGAQISNDYQEKTIILIVILKGSFIFAADLVRAITCPTTIEFMRVSSYGAQTSSCGSITFKTDLEVDINNKHVIIVEDIVDTGLTLRALRKHLQQHQPASLKVCTLIDKKQRRTHAVQVDYSGIVMNDGFIVGYGLDYNERYRDLDAIYELDPDTEEETPSS